MIIYVDVLLFINTVIDYAVLGTTERIMKRDCRLWRILSGAAVGALFSLVIFIDLHSQVYLIILRLMSTFVMTFITFGWNSKREFAKLYICGVFVSTVFCGALILFYQVFRPSDMVIVNDVAYWQTDPLMLTISTAAIYLILLGIYRLFSQRIKTTVVSLSFQTDDRIFHCIGKIDTGCDLCEPFSKAPVIIVDNSVIKIDEELPHRIVPYTAVGGGSYLNAVKAQSVTVDGKVISKDVYIASTELCNSSFQAIINSDIVQ